jgi:hypothetical protein
VHCGQLGERLHDEQHAAVLQHHADPDAPSRVDPSDHHPDANAADSERPRHLLDRIANYADRRPIR